MADRPKIVCLCGSTKFEQEFIDANRRETPLGHIVLSVGMFGHKEGIDMDGPLKESLDELHKRKIDLADEVYVLNVGGYIGDSTRSEIAYATQLGKPIRYLENPDKAVIDSLRQCRDELCRAAVSLLLEMTAGELPKRETTKEKT